MSGPMELIKIKTGSLIDRVDDKRLYTSQNDPRQSPSTVVHRVADQTAQMALYLTKLPRVRFVVYGLVDQP